jgi:putative ABC transport system ATP-binding protein
MRADPLIRCSNLHVTSERWGQTVPALIDVNLEIIAGQWVKIVGHNGSGKSTLLRVLAGHQEPTLGGAELLETSSRSGANHFDSRLFYVCQDPLRGTAEGLTLLENMIVADPRHRRISGRSARQEYLKLLSQLDLAPRAGQLLHLFSGGERQQIALLIARLRNPEILLLDEPFSAIDSARASMCEALVEVMNDAGCTVLQVTHRPRDLEKDYCRVITLDRGRITEDRLVRDGRKTN